jgi:nucleoside-diphosphate-sugar epimerase
MVESFFLSFGLPVTIVRPFNTFGPRQSARAVIPTIISQVLSGASSLQLGSLHPVRDFNYVKDIVNGFVLAATCDGALGKVLNIGSGVGISIQHTVELIVKLSGKEGSVSIDVQPDRIRPENSEVLQLVCDNTQARVILGWAPRMAFEEGLKKTIEFVSRYPQLYKPGIYSR